MVDIVFSEIDAPAADGDWKAELRSARDLDPRGAQPPPLGDRRRWSRRDSPGPATSALHNAVLGCLREAGFSIEMTVHAYSVQDAYIYGFALQESDMSRSRRPRTSPPWRSEQMVDYADALADYPYLVEVVGGHVAKAGYDYDGRVPVRARRDPRRARAAPRHRVTATSRASPLSVSTTRIALCPRSAVGPNMHGQPPSITAIPCRGRRRRRPGHQPPSPGPRCIQTCLMPSGLLVHGLLGRLWPCPDDDAVDPTGDRAQVVVTGVAFDLVGVRVHGEHLVAALAQALVDDVAPVTLRLSQMLVTAMRRPARNSDAASLIFTTKMVAATVSPDMRERPGITDLQLLRNAGRMCR